MEQHPPDTSCLQPFTESWEWSEDLCAGAVGRQTDIQGSITGIDLEASRYNEKGRKRVIYLFLKFKMNRTQSQQKVGNLLPAFIKNYL